MKHLNSKFTYDQKSVVLMNKVDFQFKIFYWNQISIMFIPWFLIMGKESRFVNFKRDKHGFEWIGIVLVMDLSGFVNL